MPELELNTWLKAEDVDPEAELVFTDAGKKTIIPGKDGEDDWPIKLILLSAMPDLAIAELASEKGIIFEIFTEGDVNKTRMAQMLPVV